MCLNNKNIMAENVLLVEDMEHNLLSVSQTCDKGHYMIFYSKNCQIRDVKTHQLVGTATRTLSNIYILDEKRKIVILGMKMKVGCGTKGLGILTFKI